MTVTLVALFLEGLLSFFSPCVLPILPVYFSLLAGGVDAERERRVVLVHTLSFVAGIAGTFFLLAFASSVFSRFLQAHSQALQIVGGGLIFLMGLVQLEVVRIPFLAREFSAKQAVYHPGKTVTPLIAFLMGFTFSFSWTPCIGPILASVFIYASSQTGLTSLVWLTVYCLGFVLPFVLLALFSQNMLAFFTRQRKHLVWTKRVSACLLLVIGISMMMGWFVQFVHFVG